MEIREIRVAELGVPAIWIGEHDILLIDRDVVPEDAECLRQQATARALLNRAG